MTLKRVLMAVTALSLAAALNPTISSAAPSRTAHGHTATTKKPSVHVRSHHGSRKAHSAKRRAHRNRGHRIPAAASSSFGFFNFGGGFGGSDVVAEARRYIGPGNPTSRRTLWCARFMNMVLERAGYKGTGSDMASSFARYGHRISGPRVGAIAVMSRGRRGGHVGVVSGIDASGNPIIISGNHGHRVAEATYSRGRIYAYVMPNG